MTFEEFLEQVKGQILDYLPKEYAGAEVTVQEVIKNNDQKLNALCKNARRTGWFPIFI